MALVLAGLLAHLTGCGNESPRAEVMALGAEVYNRPASCVTCHQAAGQGQSPLYPPLRGNERVVADDPERLIKIVTHGLTGPLDVNGKPYDATMTGMRSQLSPEEIAA